MFRNILLSALAAATLAGCATGYSYRNGNGGDYYYGQPRTEYRYHDPYGYYDSYGYGAYAPGYYYDRYGRLVYGSFYGYYGYPPGYGSHWWYRPRPPQGHGGEHHDHGGDGHGGDRNDRRPPWRNFGGVLPSDEGVMPDRDDPRPRMQREQAPSARPMLPAPQREQRSIARPAPRMGSDDGGGSRMGRAIRNAKTSPATDE